MRTIIYPVKDLGAAKDVFSVLLGGAEPVMDEVYYVQYNVDGVEVGLDPHGHSKGMTGPVTYYRVGDVDGTIKQLVEAGAEVTQPAGDVGGGKIVAVLKDADSNPIGLIQA
jgi:predicted enzyme related to lactoylglutathione lyase